MSLLNVNKVAPQSGTDFTLGDSGDTFTVPSGATLTVAGTFTQTGAQTFDGGVDIDNFNINGTTITLSSGDMTLDVAGDIVLDADGGDVFVKDAGTTFGSLTNTSGNLIIKSGTTAALTFSGANVTAAGTIGSGAITSTGIVTGTAFTAGSAVLAEAELELLDGLTAGTAIASKVVTTDANIDSTGMRNLTISGELDAATLDISGAIDIAGNSQFSGTIKVGAAATPGGTIAITTADSGATAHADADELVMENAGVAGLSILSFNNNYGNIYFGDGQDNDIGKITYLHTDNSMSFTTNTAVGLKIDSIGAVTKPLQPAFHVTNAAQNNLGTDASATITFSTEVFDVNADFNVSNYTFTAPVTGKYMLTFHMTLNAMDSASPFTYAHLDTSNREYYSWYDNNTELSGDAGYVTFHISVLADMDANDTALGKVFIGGGTAQTDLATATNTWFTGFLAC